MTETRVVSCSRCESILRTLRRVFANFILAALHQNETFSKTIVFYSPMAVPTSVADTVVVRFSLYPVMGQNRKAFGALWFSNFGHLECTLVKNHYFLDTAGNVDARAMAHSKELGFLHHNEPFIVKNKCRIAWIFFAFAHRYASFLICALKIILRRADEHWKPVHLYFRTFRLQSESDQSHAFCSSWLKLAALDSIPGTLAQFRKSGPIKLRSQYHNLFFYQRLLLSARKSDRSGSFCCNHHAADGALTIS